MLSLFLGVILVSVMLLNFKSATEFVQNQLYTDARNTAHSLGLSLSKVADPSDASSMETMINAIFDGGYYESIVLKNIDGKVIYERRNDVRVSDVPEWFIRKLTIHNVTVKSDIMMGWQRFGTLEVSGHTGNAYRQLYQTLTDLIQTFVLLGIVVYVILYWLLKWSLASLVRIKEQAKAILDNQFIIEKELPFTTEFRSAVTAMNAMVEKVKDIFDRENETLRRYHELLYRDSETKLHNRRYLGAKVPDYLHSEGSLSLGVFMLASIDEIDRFKREYGFEHYTKFMMEFGEMFARHYERYPHVLTARLNENDFIAILPSGELSVIQSETQSFSNAIQTAVEQIGSDALDYLNIGFSIGVYSDKDTVKSLFSRADRGVLQAKMQGKFVIEVSRNSEETLVLGREEWRDELLKSMEESRLLPAFQSVVEDREGEYRLLHEEIFLRLLDRDGAIHSAGYFIPVATTLGLIDTLDRYMIERVFAYIKEKNPITPLALNLSGEFVKKHSNLQWLRVKLEEFRRYSDLPLWFEVSNGVASHEIELTSALATTVKMFGHRFGIDHFTVPSSGLYYLQVIRPDYLKASTLYLKDMMIDQETGNKRESLTNVIRSLGIVMIAINIENAQDVTNLKSFGIERFQGNYIAPAALLQ